VVGALIGHVIGWVTGKEFRERFDVGRAARGARHGRKARRERSAAGLRITGWFNPGVRTFSRVKNRRADSAAMTNPACDAQAGWISVGFPAGCPGRFYQVIDFPKRETGIEPVVLYEKSRVFIRQNALERSGTPRKRHEWRFSVQSQVRRPRFKIPHMPR